jgi:hypothetical protein
VIVQRTGRRSDCIVIGMLALAMLLFVSGRWVSRHPGRNVCRAEGRHQPADSAARAPYVEMRRSTRGAGDGRG